MQDDYRVSARLTLNLGLRWDVQTPRTDPQNRFTLCARPEVHGQPDRAGRGAVLRRSRCGTRRHPDDLHPFFAPPRLCVGRPVMERHRSAAVGMFYGSISGNEWNTMTNFQPFSTRLTFTNINQKTNAAGVPLGASLVNPYNAFVGGTPFPYNGPFTNGGGLFPVAPDFNGHTPIR